MPEEAGKPEVTKLPTLFEVLDVIGGGFDTALSALVQALGVIRDEVPDLAGQVDALTGWLVDNTKGAWTREQLIVIAKQVINLFSGRGWGPPNPNAVSVV